MTNIDAPISRAHLISTCSDLIDGFRSWRLWTRFASHDMVAKYRRSWLGPLWIILSAAVFIAALGIVYSGLFQMDIGEYLPFVAIGFVAWAFMSCIATESPTTFVEAEAYIRQVRINLFVYVLRVIWRNVLIFAQQVLVALVVLLVFGKLKLEMLPLAGLGMALFFLQAVWLTPLFGVIGARFRDLQPIIASVLQVLFFITPVIWHPSMLGSRRWIADFNPLHSLISVVREPLLGNVPSVGSYLVVLLMTVAGFALTGMVYGRFKDRIVYWL